ncbi:Dual 3',5'-cyclic-AMP and -GMP phosphodiesterase 11A [Liparis tanakae]|uniref:3',5'-cyclic-GMP phosphodiesterase n=1 Tax=Liparis tanakae TaxID=230148 RepID=A0A4Z2F8S7_9TELE|nr:Dual 3',5'-cyclic-AMP and -GMP phosphodiesterase 11A [Liparis tanakae]
MVFSDVESFLDSHPELFEDYLNRKGKYSTVEKWLKNHMSSKSPAAAAPAQSREEKGNACRDSWASQRDGLQRRVSQKELRKTFARSKATNVNRTYDEHVNSRAQEPLTSMRRRALLRKASSLPPTTAHILSALLESRVNIPQYPSTAVDFKYYLKEHNEREFFLELVKDISNDLDLTSLSYKILVFVCIMVDADRCSLFLVEGTGNKKTLVSKFFDVHAGTTVLPSMNSDEVQVPWGKGIIGYVAEHGETVNMSDAYQDRRFRDEIDKLTGYQTKSLLCMPIHNSDGEIIGVAQAINKTSSGELFTEDDEKLWKRKSLTLEELSVPEASANQFSDFHIRSVLCVPIWNSNHQIIGVAQVLNRLDGQPFGDADQRLFEAFVIFCGLGINNTIMYDQVKKSWAKQSVALDVLSYHATCSKTEVDKFKFREKTSYFRFEPTILQASFTLTSHSRGSYSSSSKLLISNQSSSAY